jgi:predicted nucleotidyltransferase component of viral defense system
MSQNQNQFKSIASIMDRLKNRSKKENTDFNKILREFFLERLLFRISISDYCDNFILKGGFALHFFYNQNYPRITVDMDLLGLNTNNSIDSMKQVFSEILSINYSLDFITYDLTTLEVKEINQNLKYRGVCIKITSYLGSIRENLSIDISFSDIVTPQKQELLSVLDIDSESVYFNSYPIENIIGEKLETLVQRGVKNSRLKDIYDLQKLLTEYPKDLNVLSNTIKKIFIHRNTSIDESSLKNIKWNDKSRNRWEFLMRKKQIKDDITLDEAVRKIDQVVSLIIDDLKD